MGSILRVTRVNIVHLLCILPAIEDFTITYDVLKLQLPASAWPFHEERERARQTHRKNIAANRSPKLFIWATREVFESSSAIDIIQRLHISVREMEVASPLAFPDSTGGAKRPLSYSPQLIESGSHEMDIGDEPRYKRRRFHAEPSSDNISPRVSHYGPSFHNNKSIFTSSPGKKRNGLFLVDAVLVATVSSGHPSVELTCF